jgi:hypothetical protein
LSPSWVFGDDIEEEEEWRERTNSTPSIINPIRGKQATKRRHENAATIILDALGAFIDFGAIPEEPEIVHQELDSAAGDRNAAFERVNWLSLEIICDGRQEPVLRYHGFLADIVEQETARAVGVLCATGLETFLSDESGRLVA